MPLSDLYLLLIFFPQLSARNNFCFTETYDPQTNFCHTSQILHYNRNSLDFQLILGCYRGPPCACMCMLCYVRLFATLWTLLFFSHQVVSTLCDTMDCSTPGFPVLPYLLEFAQMPGRSQREILDSLG